MTSIVRERRLDMMSDVRWVGKGGADKGDTMERVRRHVLIGGCGCVRRQTGNGIGGRKRRMITQGEEQTAIAR